jgi:hypothetical protein
VANEKRPYVVDGVLTKAFFDDVAAADEQARARVGELPKCDRCGRPLCCGQPALHHNCAWGVR